MRGPQVLERRDASRAVVTVVVMTYNHEGYIADCLQAILKQETDFHVNVVVHDDASTDRTPEVLADIHSQHPDRLMVILQRDNQLSQGVCGPALYMPYVDTTYVAFCDGDDLWNDPLKLQRQVDFMAAREWCSISHHAVAVLDESAAHDYEGQITRMLSEPWREVERVPGRELARRNFIMACSCMIRVDALRPDVLAAMHDIGPEDWVVFALAAENGDVGYLPDDMATYRLHQSNFWAGMDETERWRQSMDALWFMAAHLRGDLQDTSREALLDSLIDNPAVRELRPPRLSALISESESRDEQLRGVQAEFAARDAERANLLADLSALRADHDDLERQRVQLIEARELQRVESMDALATLRGALDSSEAAARALGDDVARLEAGRRRLDEETRALREKLELVEVAALDAQSARALAERAVAELEVALGEHRQALAASEAARGAALEALAASDMTHRILREAVVDAESQAHRLSDSLRALESSRSWRATRPLRRLRGIFRSEPDQ